MVRVEIVLKDGSHLEQTVEAPRGSEQSFAGEADIVAKMRKLCAGHIDDDKAERIVDWMLHAEDQDDTAVLARLLAAGKNVS